MTTTQRVALLAGLLCLSLAGMFATLTVLTADGGVSYFLGGVIFIALAIMLIAASRPPYHDDFWSNS